MTPETGIPESIVREQIRKLGEWYDLLRKVMPPYFFRNFSDGDLRDILPMLFDIENKTGVQVIERRHSIILVYLKGSENLTAAGGMAAGRRILRSVLHESKPLPGSGKVLVVEQIAKDEGEETGPVVPSVRAADLKKVYRSEFGTVHAGFDELYGRLNWRELNDLDSTRLVKRIELALEVQKNEYSAVMLEEVGAKEYRLTVACPTIARQEGYYARTLELLDSNGFHVSRSYLREFSHDSPEGDFSRKAVRCNTFYIHPASKAAVAPDAIRLLKQELSELNWSVSGDVFSEILMRRYGFCVMSLNLLRAAAGFVHAQLAVTDRNAYTREDIPNFMTAYPILMREMVLWFEKKFDPEKPALGKTLDAKMEHIRSSILEIDSGLDDKDRRVRTVLSAVRIFLENIRRSNYFSGRKTALAFELSPTFLDSFAELLPEYASALPRAKPRGVYYFYRRNMSGFHIRFGEISRGGWRTLIPRAGRSPVDRTESFEEASANLFRVTLTLAETQNRKNKDICEAGAKMVTLFRPDDPKAAERELWSAQRAVFDAFLSVAVSGEEGDIMEFGPEKNLSPRMLSWMGSRAAETGCFPGAAAVSGKPETGLDHRKYGVNASGVHRYLLRTLEYLGIDPAHDPFTLVVTGGPAEDVPGNLIRRLNGKNESRRYVFPKLEFLALTDSTAALFDPEGIDRPELTRLAGSVRALSDFNPEKLRGEGAFLLIDGPELTGSGEQYRIMRIEKGILREERVSRDEFFRLCRGNLRRKTDLFIPCGAGLGTAPEMITSSGIADARAVIEGTNAYFSHEAAMELQNAGTLLIRDASANKCGVIASSCETLCGLLLTPEELAARAAEIAEGIAELLKRDVDREADWLFSEFRRTGVPMSELSRTLSSSINAKKEKIREYLRTNPLYASDDVLLEHLPSVIGRDFRDRLKNLPVQYRIAAAAAELACRIVYAPTDDIPGEVIRSARAIAESRA